MDLRPQAHEIIRTWLFSSVVRAHLEDDTLPWRHAAISGWILDPDRKKMSKSKGNVVTPADLLEQHGVTRFGMGRLGSARHGHRLRRRADEDRPAVGDQDPERLQVRALGMGATIDSAAITAPLDLALLARLRNAVAAATDAFENYNYTRALEVSETFFWSFCDDYLELVKDRAYGTRGQTGADSAKATLALALSIQLRLFAPFLPFVTEEVWSWWQLGSVHRANWPTVDEIEIGSPVDDSVLVATAASLGLIRKAKSENRLSMRTELPSATISASPEALAAIEAGADDLAAAGRILELNLGGGGELAADVVCRLRSQPRSSSGGWPAGPTGHSPCPAPTPLLVPPAPQRLRHGSHLEIGHWRPALGDCGRWRPYVAANARPFTDVAANARSAAHPPRKWTPWLPAQPAQAPEPAAPSWPGRIETAAPYGGEVSRGWSGSEGCQREGVLVGGGGVKVGDPASSRRRDLVPDGRARAGGGDALAGRLATDRDSAAVCQLAGRGRLGSGFGADGQTGPPGGQDDDRGRRRGSGGRLWSRCRAGAAADLRGESAHRGGQGVDI
jgi:hypothetical protein